jgi:hypothetical protein
MSEFKKRVSEIKEKEKEEKEISETLSLHEGLEDYIDGMDTKEAISRTQMNVLLINTQQLFLASLADPTGKTSPYANNFAYINKQVFELGVFSMPAMSSEEVKRTLKLSVYLFSQQEKIIKDIIGKRLLHGI